MDDSDDLDSPSGRLKWARERAGFVDASLFAKAIGMNPITYRAYETGQNGYTKHAQKFAMKLKVPIDWLLSGGSPPEMDLEDRPALAQFGTPDLLSDQFGIELVRQVDIRYSMGDGAVIEDYPDIGSMPFAREFLRAFTKAAAEHLFVANGHGDSMEPTIRRDEWLMIDTSQNRLSMQDQIWALSYAGTGMVKRLRRLSGGRVTILSDNPSIPPQDVDEEEIFIVGKVVWASRGVN